MAHFTFDISDRDTLTAQDRAVWVTPEGETFSSGHLIFPSARMAQLFVGMMEAEKDRTRAASAAEQAPQAHDFATFEEWERAVWAHRKASDDALIERVMAETSA